MVYSIAPAKTVDSKTYESFSFATLREYLDLVYGKKTLPSESGFAYEDYYSFHEGEYRFVPYAGGDDAESLIINYLAEGASFPKLSFVDVYEGRYPPEAVKDRIVLIGATATALHDVFFTPTG